MADSSGASTRLRYASVCDGIGAAHVAWQPLGWQCQWTSEIEPFPVAVVEHHYGFRNLGDMTKITEDMIDAPVDLLVGGTPCQSFSVAGLRGGLADPRGNLALRFVQLAAVMQPRWVVWENVPGVLSSGKGRDFGTFLGALGELGYGFAYRVLDAQWFGVAQRRRRVFVVGYLGDWRRAAAVLFERESVFGNPPTRGKAWQGVARSTAASLTSSGRGVERCRESRGQDDVVLAAPQVANPLTARMGKGINTTCDEGQTPIVSFDWQKGNDKTNSRPSTMNIVEESTPTIGNTRVPAVAYDILGTLATNGAKRTDVHTALRGRTPGQSEASTTTVVALQDCGSRDKKQNGKGWNADGTAYTVDAAATQGVAAPASGVDFQNCSTTGEVCGTLMGEAQKKGGEAGHGVMQPLAVRTAQTSANGHGVAQGVCHTLDQAQGQAVMTPTAVRRLTPMECERLQGFPDHYTAITYRNKPAADGPRYRALGNSMAVPVMRWIGERIRMVEGQ